MDSELENTDFEYRGNDGPISMPGYQSGFLNMWRLFRKQCRMSMWCLRQRQCGKVLTQTTVTQSKSNLYNYTATCTSAHATTCYIMRLTGKY